MFETIMGRNRVSDSGDVTKTYLSFRRFFVPLLHLHRMLLFHRPLPRQMISRNNIMVLLQVIKVSLSLKVLSQITLSALGDGFYCLNLPIRLQESV